MTNDSGRISGRDQNAASSLLKRRPALRVQIVTNRCPRRSDAGAVGDRRTGEAEHGTQQDQAFFRGEHRVRAVHVQVADDNRRRNAEVQSRSTGQIGRISQLPSCYRAKADSDTGDSAAAHRAHARRGTGERDRRQTLV